MMNSNVNELRKKIDSVDDEILSLLSQRMQIVREIGALKRQLNLPPRDEKRWQEILDSRHALALKVDLSPVMVSDIYQCIHEEALRLQLVKSDSLL